MFNLSFSLPGLFSRHLYRAIKVSGPLEILGAGSKMVSVRQLQSLRRWRLVLMAAPAPLLPPTCLRLCGHFSFGISGFLLGFGRFRLGFWFWFAL